MWKAEDLREQPAGDYGSYSKAPQPRPVLDDEVNLVGSKCATGDKHIPLFDFDFPVEVVESSTPGHFHVYLEREVNWTAYVGVLRAMAKAGLVQHGWVAEAERTQCAFLRPPHILKESAWQSRLDALAKEA